MTVNKVVSVQVQSRVTRLSASIDLEIPPTRRRRCDNNIVRVVWKLYSCLTITAS